jgi:hypothetical protein
MRAVPQGPFCEVLARVKKASLLKKTVWVEAGNSENELARPHCINAIERELPINIKQGCDNLLTMLNFLCYFLPIFCV